MLCPSRGGKGSRTPGSRSLEFLMSSSAIANLRVKMMDSQRPNAHGSGCSCKLNTTCFGVCNCDSPGDVSPPSLGGLWTVQAQEWEQGTCDAQRHLQDQAAGDSKADSKGPPVRGDNS